MTPAIIALDATGITGSAEDHGSVESVVRTVQASVGSATGLRSGVGGHEVCRFV